MFYNCENLKYIDFYHFYETNRTILTNFINRTHAELKLCFNITKNNRLYQLYETKFIENCLFYEVIPSTLIETLSDEYINDSNALSNYLFDNSSRIITTNTLIKSSLLQKIIDITNLNISEIADTFNIKKEKIIYNFNRFLNMSLNIKEINETIYNEIKIDQIIVKFTSTNYLKNYSNENITTINLGTCENILKNFYNISKDSSLYILFLEILQDGMKIPKIEYEVFNLIEDNEDYDLTQLNLTLCGNTKIEISIPVSINDENIDKYNSSSGYYNDICYPSKSDSGTDICLNDRREEFIDNNLTLCEEDCDLIEYDYTYKKAKCSCEVKINLPLIEDIKIDKEKLKKKFIDINNIANIKFMKCYKIVFKRDNIKSNYGFYIMIVIFCIFLICLFLFYFKYYKKYLLEISDVISPLKEDNNQEHIITYKDQIKSNIINEEKKNSVHEEKKISKRKKSRKKIKVKKGGYSMVKSKEFTNPNLPKEKNNVQLSDNPTIKNEVGISIFNKIDKKDSSKNIVDNQFNNLDYNNLELNRLSYEKALDIDKRTYLQYYISLLKMKHLLLFSFYPNMDYNSRIIKIKIFFFSISFLNISQLMQYFIQIQPCTKYMKTKALLISFIKFLKYYIHLLYLLY